MNNNKLNINRKEFKRNYVFVCVAVNKKTTLLRDVKISVSCYNAGSLSKYKRKLEKSDFEHSSAYGAGMAYAAGNENILRSELVSVHL